MKRLGLCVTLLIGGFAAGCGDDGPDGVQCSLDSHCNRQPNGECTEAPSGNHWCAFPDTACPSGLRYDQTDVGDGLAGQCVVAPDAGVDASAPDANNPIDAQGCDEAIIFQSTRTGSSQIFRMKVDGTEQTNLSTMVGADHLADWNATTNLILLTSSRQGSEVYSMAMDGSEQTNLSMNSAGNWTPRWSPDGTQIVWTSNADGDTEIWKMNADGSGQTNLTNNTLNDEKPRWSPDGAKILWSQRASGGKSGLWVMDEAGTNPQQLTDGGTDASGDWRGGYWSPDGTMIAFYRGTNIWVMSATGLSQRIVAAANPATQSPARHTPWTADSTRLIVIQDGDIVSVPVSGGSTIDITDSTDEKREAQATSFGVMFSRGPIGQVDIWRANGDGSGAANITNTLSGANGSAIHVPCQ